MNTVGRLQTQYKVGEQTTPQRDSCKGACPTDSGGHKVLREESWQLRFFISEVCLKDEGKITNVCTNSLALRQSLRNSFNFFPFLLI